MMATIAPQPTKASRPISRIRYKGEQEYEATVGEAEPTDGGGLAGVVACALFFGGIDGFVEPGEKFADVGFAFGVVPRQKNVVLRNRSSRR